MSRAFSDLWVKFYEEPVLLAGRSAPLYKHKDYPFLWKWKSNIARTESESEAMQIFEKQIFEHPDDEFWASYGTPGFVLTLGRQRSKLYQHKCDPTFWKWKDYAFYATSIQEIDAHIRQVFLLNGKESE